LNWTINVSSLDWGTWSFTPQFGINLTPGDGQVTVQVSVVAPNQKNTKFEGYVRVENQGNPEDFDLVPIFLKTPTITQQNAPVFHFLKTTLFFFLLKK